MNALNFAIDHAGGASRLAALLGIGQSAVSNWRARGTPPEEVHCVAIEHCTDGAVTVEELRPNARWRRIPDPDWPHPEGRPLLDFAPDRPTAQEVGNV